MKIRQLISFIMSQFFQQSPTEKQIESAANQAASTLQPVVNSLDNAEQGVEQLLGGPSDLARAVFYNQPFVLPNADTRQLRERIKQTKDTRDQLKDAYDLGKSTN